MKRTNLIAIASVLGALFLVGTHVWASETDAQIESSAKQLYVFRTFLKGDSITIKSEKGIVTLTGTVESEPHRMLAQESVANLEGVKNVNNELKIKGEPSVENSDAWIGVNVKTLLFFSRNVSSRNTDVSVKDGVVTLRGEADNSAQKSLTTEYAKDIAGVKDVKNEMTIAKSPSQPKETVGEKIDDASITAQVKFSLLFHHATRVLKTQVKTQDGVVTLSGMAKNSAEKTLVTKLVNEINGVTEVNNEMTIQEP